METLIGTETEVDERPHYFTLILQKSATDLFCTLPEDTRSSFDETVKPVRHDYNEKSVMTTVRPARGVQQSDEKIKKICDDVQNLELKRTFKNILS